MHSRNTRTDTPTVSIVVRTLNEAQHIARLLVGIQQQRGVETEVVIVDSGSTDGTVEIASRFPVTVLHIRPQDFSFGRSLNVGIRATTSDVVVAASAHVYPQRDDWLAQLISPFSEPTVAVTYGRQVGHAGSAFSERMILRAWFPAISDPRQHHPFCNNANAAIRRSLWETCAYDEGLTGLEDLAWARHMMASGYTVSYVAEAEVVHVHRESWSRVLSRYQREAIAHRRIYGEQRMSRSEALWLCTRNILGDLRGALEQRCMWREGANVVRFRSAQFLGTYRGFAQEGSIPETLKRRFYYPPDRDPRRFPPPTAAGSIPYDELLSDPESPSRSDAS